MIFVNFLCNELLTGVSCSIDLIAVWLQIRIYYNHYISGADPGFLKGGQNYKGAPHKYRECSQKLLFKHHATMHNARF